MAIKFGPEQLLNPTPEAAKKVFRVFFLATSVIALSLKCFPQIPHDIKAIVNEWIISGDSFVFGITRMFGFDMDGPREERKEPEPAKEES